MKNKSFNANAETSSNREVERRALNDALVARYAVEGTTYEGYGLDHLSADLLDSLGIGVMVYGADGTFFTSNHTARALLGLTAEQLNAKTTPETRWNAIDEMGLDFPDDEHPVRRACLTCEPVRDVLMGVRRPILEDLVWVIVNADPYFTEEGDIDRIVCSFRDVTAHKAAEERLRGSEENYRVLAESMDDIVSLHDATGRILYISPSIQKATGYGPEEILGMDSNSFVHPDDRERIYQKTHALHLQGLPSHIEWRRLSKDGAYRWCETRTNPLFDEKGTLYRLLCTTRDITERRQAESALRKTNKRLANILESLQEGFVAIDRQWRVSFLNAKAEAIFSRKRETLIGKILWEEFPEWIGSRSYHAYHRAMSKQVSVSFEEYIPQSELWLQIQAYPSQDGLSIYAQDITARHNVDQELRRSLNKLERSVKGIAEAMALAVEYRDPYTAGHQRRVSILAGGIAREMGFPEKQIDEIRLSGLLHDVGKISVPSEILSKPGRLSDAEMSIIRVHAQVGYEMLKGIDFDAPVALVALQHHERLDGSGYPSGLVGDQILLEARIMAVADVVDAMSSHRPYRPAMGLEVALAEIVRGKGIRYDTMAVEACMRALAHHAFDLEQMMKTEGL